MLPETVTAEELERFVLIDYSERRLHTGGCLWEVQQGEIGDGAEGDDWL